ncbi:hypothetical protein GCM10027578_20890 [Spirosoma luteolum]
MNILLEYPELENDIKTAFKETIDRNNFNFQHLKEGQYILYNNLCEINISYDRGDIYCFFINPKDLGDDSKYPVLAVYKHLLPDQYQDNAWYDAKIKLEKIAYIIRNNLQNVLKGDFSWAHEFKQKQLFLRKLIKYVSNDMDRDSIIYKKFRQNDPSWMEDLNIYISKNKITL